jgi:hypothetical protein
VTTETEKRMVKRWGLSAATRAGQMIKHENGEFVLYSDCYALESERDELKLVVSDIKADYLDLQKDFAETARNLRHKRDALVAENARLSEQLEQANGLLRASREAISNAIAYANGRESEWGERAEGAFAFLYNALQSIPQLPPAPTALEKEGEKNG